MDKRYLPTLRFKEFENAASWEQRKLYEVADFNPKSELPNTFEYVDLESVVGTEMISHRTETRDTAPSRAQRLAQTGDVFFQTVRPYQRNNYLFAKSDNNYVFSTGYAQMRPKIDAEFLMCFLQTDSFVKVVLDNCTGTSYPAINSNDLSNLEIVLPISVDEQREIGGFIRNLDNLITLHQRKLVKLIRVKQAYLNEMFPQKGEKYPTRRFPGFTEPWEQCKISSMITDIADGPFGSNLKTEHYIDEKEARIIQLSNLSDYGWNDENTKYTSFEHAKEIKRCIINEGELVMGKMMPAGMTIMRPNNEKMYVLSSDCVRIKLDNSKATDKFFLYTTKSDTFLNQINSDSQGSTRVRTSISKIKKMDISMPSITEQEKIGDFFTNLDNLITLQQRKLEKLKKLKSAYLDAMFV